MDADLDDTDNLEKFLGVLINFNKNVPLKPEFRERIVRFFDYKWRVDKNQAIDDPDEKAILD